MEYIREALANIREETKFLTKLSSILVFLFYGAAVAFFAGAGTVFEAHMALDVSAALCTGLKSVFGLWALFVLFLEGNNPMNKDQ
ncbi:MAG: hypothetical protein LBR73_08680 [Oscillospiraceae bacterium]|jgi:Na+/pantothenate symporter|nr:hypothetical protein [Oscillospiraceae bacterium]